MPLRTAWYLTYSAIRHGDPYDKRESWADVTLLHPLSYVHRIATTHEHTHTDFHLDYSLAISMHQYHAIKHLYPQRA